MTRIAAAVVAALLAAGCSEGAPDGSAGSADTLTKRQRDSAVAESGLPGAGGVREALDAADSARARTRRVDSLAGGE